MGVAVSKWHTMHGMALNVCPNMAHYDAIVPCGLADRGVTSLARLLSWQDRDAATLMADVKSVVKSKVEGVFGVELQPAEFPTSLPPVTLPHFPLVRE